MRILKVLAALLPLFALLAVVPLALAEAPVTLHGLAPLPDDQKVPHRMLPPGSFDPDDGPSDVIFPAQHITLRFNHQKHLAKGMQLTCKTCHGKAYGSASSQDVLLPRGSTCDACHSTDHDDLNGNYTVWGQCDNVNVVKQIARVKTDSGDKPLMPVHIQKVIIERVGPAPADAPEAMGN